MEERPRDSPEAKLDSVPICVFIVPHPPTPPPPLPTHTHSAPILSGAFTGRFGQRPGRLTVTGQIIMIRRIGARNAGQSSNHVLQTSH